MKPGYRSSEFWLTVASNIIGALMASGILADGSSWSRLVGMAAMVLAGMGYSVSRGMVKAASPAVPTAIDSTSLRAGQS
jgi:hypothetical protein